MSTVPAPPAPSTLSDADYRRETDTLLARIEATTDRWLDEDVVDIDTRRTGGLLELSFVDGSKPLVLIVDDTDVPHAWMECRTDNTVSYTHLTLPTSDLV